MRSTTLGESFEDWVVCRPEIKAALLLGSRAREMGVEGAWDAGSDWDFQIVTSDPELFAGTGWVDLAGLPKPLAYVARRGRVAPITKLSGVFPNGDIDIVLLPLRNLQLAKFLMNIGHAQRIPRVWNGLVELATVLTPGYRLIKGGRRWGSFFGSIVSEFPVLRLTDKLVCELAEAYVIDYTSTKKKLIRGEYIAAQRWLHIHLAETNFRLLHELRTRLREPTFPDARRMEKLAGDDWREAVSLSALLQKDSLLDALEKSAVSLRVLVRELVGLKWKWPL